MVLVNQIRIEKTILKRKQSTKDYFESAVFGLVEGFCLVWVFLWVQGLAIVIIQEWGNE